MKKLAEELADVEFHLMNDSRIQFVHFVKEFNIDLTNFLYKDLNQNAPFLLTAKKNKNYDVSLDLE